VSYKRNSEDSEVSDRGTGARLGSGLDGVRRKQEGCDGRDHSAFGAGRQSEYPSGSSEQPQLQDLSASGHVCLVSNTSRRPIRAGEDATRRHLRHSIHSGVAAGCWRGSQGCSHGTMALPGWQQTLVAHNVDHRRRARSRPEGGDPHDWRGPTAVLDLARIPRAMTLSPGPVFRNDP
jgi:hypothetical protein